MDILTSVFLGSGEGNFLQDQIGTLIKIKKKKKILYGYLCIII